MSSGLVYVLDDDADLAGSVSRLLRRHGYRAEAFIEPEALLAAYPGEPAECVLADVMMPEMGGFAFADALLEQNRAAAIVFMTAWPKTDDAVEAIRDHAGFDYITKPLDETRLLGAVSQAVARSRKRSAAQTRLGSLSPRELQVFDLLVRGYTNKEIALELSLSARTIEDHRAAVIRKTSAKTMAELMELGRDA